MPQSNAPGRGLVGLGVAALAALAAVPTLASAAPPIDRAFEKISPVDKNGGQVLRMAPVLNATGDAVLYAQTAGNVDSAGGLRSTPSVAIRTPSGWQTRDASARHADDWAGENFFVFGAAADGSTVFTVSTRPLTPEHPEGGYYSINPLTQSATWLGSSTPPINAPLTNDWFVTFRGVPEDGRVVRARPGGEELVSILPDGSEASANGRFLTTPLPWDDGIDAAASARAQGTTTGVGNGWTHNVSADGRRVFFNSGPVSTNPSYDPTVANPLYLRDGDDRTVAVSASRRGGDDGTAYPARFIGASADGDTSYFYSEAALTADGTGGGVYRYRLSDDELIRLSGETGIGAGDITTAWSSEDASTVYFVASAALTADADGGVRNAYVWRNGALRLIGAIGLDGSVQRVSRNGDFAVFQSSSSLGASVDTGGTPQLYRYAYGDDALSCASCRSDGSPNEGASAIVVRPQSVVTEISNPRGITDDGNVIFTSADRLVPEDPSTAPDAYEFTDAGVRMLSTGRGSTYVTDNTDDGRSVFMVSSDALDPGDTDGNEYDLFVARAGGGFPKPVPPPPCGVDECRPGTQPGTTSPAPGSTAPGAGNIGREAPATKPRILSRGALSASAKRALAQGRQANITLRIQGGGKLTVRLRGRANGRTRTLATASRTIKTTRAGQLSIPVRLNTSGRRELRRAGRLRLRIEVRLAGAASTTTVTLRRAGR